jgi:sugar/nucleoside kinase (ribokinase family)
MTQKRHHTFKAVVAGHICLDIIPEMGNMLLSSPSDFYQPGTLRLIGKPCFSTGGAVSNTGLSLLKLGMDVTLMGKIGEDYFGRIIKDILRDNWGVGDGMISVKGETTAYTLVLTPGKYDRMFLHHPGANQTFSAKDIPYEKVAQADLFHFGYPPLMEKMYANQGEELVEIFKRVKEMEVTTSLDMAYPDPESPAGKADWGDILAQVLPYVDIFFPSYEEILSLLHPQQAIQSRLAGFPINPQEESFINEISGLADELLQLGVKIVGIKCGSSGIYTRTASQDKLKTMVRPGFWNPAQWAEKERWEPAYQPETIVNANGSGDAAIAGFLAAYLHGESLESALHCAAAAGACNLTKADTVSGIRSWEETNELINRGWAKLPFQINSPGWKAIGGGQWAGPRDA